MSGPGMSSALWRLCGAAVVGLTLLAGNAGGLEVFVDGVAIPRLGPVGAVRRDVPLEPGRLRNGTAQAPSINAFD